MTILARDLLLERFRWIGGHADMWPLFRDGKSFKAIVQALVASFRNSGITVVRGIESRGFRNSLRIQRASLGPADRVLLVDDWIETGSRALAVRELVDAAGAELLGCAVVIDQTRADAKQMLGSFHALMSSDELPDA
jgi:adenine phosphoribosyltransferase